MSLVKHHAERMICHVLRSRNAPEDQWADLVKKTGRGMILLGVALVVPLLLVDAMPLPVTIVLQIAYACLMCLGVILAFDNKTAKGRS